ncbi:DEAD/DEAH box helicase, partial [Geoglobus sp.]
MIVQGRPYSDEEIKSHLNPLLREWFEEKYGQFTPPQRYSIVEAFKGNNVLISSPTGSGKTLAAFMTALSKLLDRAMENSLENRVYVVYVSPLKALNNDIRKNLEEPLGEIYGLAERKNVKLQRIRIAVRTGDTDSGEKQRQLRKPPHILITTPESLAIVLCSPKFSRSLRNVEFLIVDELHSLAENKRGSHLSLSIERLEEIQEGKMVRVGLSATIHPLEEVARFLVGYENGRERDCVVADVTFEKKMDIRVISPVDNLFSATAEEISERMYSTLAEMIRNSRTTLVFTNTRSATERVVFNLKKVLGEDFPVAAHHSSLSKEVRLEVEEKLKNGELRCVVSSTSLELGIDIGYIDLVVLLGSPKSISRALQRIGRSGHRLHEVSRGRIVVVDHDDLVECSVLAREALMRRLD